MNKLHESIRLEYWKHKDSSYYWKDIYTNNLWEIFREDNYFEFNRFIEDKEEEDVRLSTYELIDEKYSNEFRYDSYGRETYKVLYIEDLMWFKFYDYEDKQELYICVNTKTLEANVYTEIEPLLLLGI